MDDNDDEDDAGFASGGGGAFNYAALRMQAQQALGTTTLRDRLVALAHNPVQTRILVAAPAAAQPQQQPAGEPLELVVERSLAEERRARKRARDAAVTESESAAEADDAAADTAREGPFAIRCFMCAYGNRAYDGVDMGCGPYQRLREMIKDLYDNMSLDELCVSLANYYYVHIYRPDRDAARRRGDRPRLPYMKPEDFEKHLLCHHRNQHIRLGVVNDLVYNAVLTLRAEYSNGGKQREEKLHKLGSLMIKMAALPRSALAFTGGDSDELQLDPAALGNVTNARHIAPLLARRSDVLGGATATDSDASALQGARNFARAVPSREGAGAGGGPL